MTYFRLITIFGIIISLNSSIAQISKIELLNYAKSDPITIATGTTVDILLTAYIEKTKTDNNSYSVRFVIAKSGKLSETELCRWNLNGSIWLDLPSNSSISYLNTLACSKTQLSSYDWDISSNGSVAYLYAVVENGSTGNNNIITSSPIEVTFGNVTTTPGGGGGTTPPDVVLGPESYCERLFRPDTIISLSCVDDNVNFRIAGSSSNNLTDLGGKFNLVVDCVLGNYHKGRYQWYKSNVFTSDKSKYSMFYAIEDGVGGYQAPHPCAGAIDKINDITYYYRTAHDWLCVVGGGYYITETPKFITNTIVVYPKSFSLQAKMSGIDLKDNKYYSVDKVTNCNTYILGVNAPKSINVNDVYFKWTIPEGWTLNSTSVEGKGRNLISATPTNLGSATSGVFSVEVTFAGGCRTENFTISRTVQYWGNVPKPKFTNDPSKLSNGNVFETGDKVRFTTGNNKNDRATTWEFFADGIKLPSTSFTMTPIVTGTATNFDTYRSVYFSMPESYFNGKTKKSAKITAAYSINYSTGCGNAASETSNPAYLISQSYVPGAPTVGNGSYTGICAGSPITLKSNDVGNTAKKWEFFMDNSTTPLTTSSGAYIVNKQTNENINVTFNEDILYNDYAKIRARYIPAYNRTSTSVNMTMTRPSDNINPRNVVITGRCTQGSADNPNKVRIKLLCDGLDYKSVTLAMRQRISNTSGSALGITGPTPIVCKRDANGDYFTDFVFPDYLAGRWIEYQFKVQVGCNTYNMYAYPTNQAERNARNFQLNSIPTQASLNIEIYNGRNFMYVDPSVGPAAVCRNDYINIGSYLYQNNQRIAQPITLNVKVTIPSTGYLIAEGISQNGEVGVDLSNTQLSSTNSIKVEATGQIYVGQCYYDNKHSETLALFNSTINTPAFITPFPDAFQGRPQNQFYCKGNNLFLYPQTVTGALGYRWKSSNDDVYTMDRLKVVITDPYVQRTSYYVAAYDGKCYTDYSPSYYLYNINQDASQVAPSPLSFTGFTDAIDVIDNTKYRVASVAPTNSSETGLEYVWYYGRMAQASNASVDCVYPPYTENLGFYKSGIDDKTVLTRYRYYNNIYEYLERCDYVVMTKNGSCYSDPLIVYTGNPQLPQYRRGFEEENANTTIKIYPNPANDIVNIETNFENYEVEIKNVLGTTVFAKKNNAFSSQLSTDEFVNGLYLVSIKSNTESKTIKLQIIR